MDIKALNSRKTSFASRNVGGELVLVPLKNNIAEMNKLFTLNEVGAFIWDNIDDKKTIEDIVDLVMKEFEIDPETAQKDTLEFLEQLGKLTSED